MKKMWNVLILFFVAGSVIAGCGQSKPRGRLEEREDQAPRKIAFSPICCPGRGNGVEGMCTPGGTRHFRVTGIAELAHDEKGAPKEAGGAGSGAGRGDEAPDSKEHPRVGGARRGQVFFAEEDDALAREFSNISKSVTAFQAAWIAMYAETQALSGDLDSLREQALWRFDAICEAAKMNEPVEDAFRVTMLALRQAYDGLRKEFLPLSMAALSLGMEFFETAPDVYMFEKILISDSPEQRFRKQAVQLLNTPMALECVLDCDLCSAQIPWNGSLQRHPMCCSRSLLILRLHGIQEAKGFDFINACVGLADFSLDVKLLREKVRRHLTKLAPKKK